MGRIEGVEFFVTLRWKSAIMHPDSQKERNMKHPFNAVYTPDYQELFNPKPVGTQVDPCVRHDQPPSYPDFARISEVVRKPNFDDLFGQKAQGLPTNPNVQR